MADQIESTAAPLEIAVLKEKERKKIQYHNLMEPGTGTPWEQRGDEGIFKAFFKTALLSMFRPVKLLRSIHRPETTGDVNGFLFGCSLFWVASCAVHGYIVLGRYLADKKTYNVDEGIFWFGTAIQCMVTIAAVYLFVKFCTVTYFKLISSEVKGRAPSVLMYNILGYCMGPSLLAPIPIVGPPLALLWILILFMIAGIKRLHVSAGGAIIGAGLTLICAGAIGVAVYFAGNFIWYQVTEGAIQLKGKAVGRTY
jgi:hypothetical protein